MKIVHITELYEPRYAKKPYLKGTFETIERDRTFSPVLIDQVVHADIYWTVHPPDRGSVTRAEVVGIFHYDHAGTSVCSGYRKVWGE